jgi:hypothetical protein
MAAPASQSGEGLGLQIHLPMRPYRAWIDEGRRR